jgi:hypothetical protein
VSPRPTKQRKATWQRKGYDEARRAPVVIDVNDPKWANLRDQLTDATTLSAEDSAVRVHALTSVPPG